MPNSWTAIEKYAVYRQIPPPPRFFHYSIMLYCVLQDDACFILPARCFPLALPEFHILCASGAAGEDRKTLDDALANLSMVSRMDARMDEFLPD